MNKYFAIIPAAGIGMRMNTNIPKQYLTVNQEIILEKIINLFSSCTQIEKIIVALNPADHLFKTLNLKHIEKIRAENGGKTRAHSVLNCLNSLSKVANEHDFVLVHDASRPFLTLKNIADLISACENHPVGGILGMPLVDTIKKVDTNNNIIETVSRENLWQAQTPQLFRYKILQHAIQSALNNKKNITDEASAIELLGYSPKMVLSSRENFKITYPEDMQ